MEMTFLHEHPFAKNEDGRLKTKIATAFPRAGVVVTDPPPIHACQRLVHTNAINAQRATTGLPPLTPEEEQAQWEQSVDLFLEVDGTVLIRPEPQKMALAFEADEMLQEVVPKQKIRFLNARYPQVRQAVKERGECWRISPMPRSVDEIRAMIQGARLGVGGEAIYYYNRETGTRFLTYEQFCRLGEHDSATLRKMLVEIREHSSRKNRFEHPELDFITQSGTFGAANFAGTIPVEAMSDADLRSGFEALRGSFHGAVNADLEVDDLDNPRWRNRMFVELTSRETETVSVDLLEVGGTPPDFFLQTRWLPGGMFDEGELLYDTVFDSLGSSACGTDGQPICDPRVKGFIGNYVREFRDIEHINVGAIPTSKREPTPLGRAGAYVAEIKHADDPKPVVRILRVQRVGIIERMDAEHKDLLTAILESEEYTDYIHDRRLACWQLGMRLPPRIMTRRVSEIYYGIQRKHHGTRLWSTYFERDYIPGIATDKIPLPKLRDSRYSHVLAQLLGKAAAPNLIVGRMTADKSRVVFDGGDEIVVEGRDGLPADIIVADHAGTFVEYTDPLERHAPAYAGPVSCRLAHLSDPNGFQTAYIEAFVAQFRHVQDVYRKRRRAFDSLLKHAKQGDGTLADRWRRVLDRLAGTDAEQLGQRILSRVAPPAVPAK